MGQAYRHYRQGLEWCWEQQGSMDLLNITSAAWRPQQRKLCTATACMTLTNAPSFTNELLAQCVCTRAVTDDHVCTHSITVMIGAVAGARRMCQALIITA